jgi:transposase
MSGGLSRVEKIYIRTGYDMRKQLDGLIDIIQYSFKHFDQQVEKYVNSK